MNFRKEFLNDLKDYLVANYDLSSKEALELVLSKRIPALAFVSEFKDYAYQYHVRFCANKIMEQREA